MMVKESDNDNELDMIEDRDDSLHYASLFVIPRKEAARDKTREMLHKRLEEEMPSLATTATSRRQSSKSSLLLETRENVAWINAEK